MTKIKADPRRGIRGNGDEMDAETREWTAHFRASMAYARVRQGLTLKEVGERMGVTGESVRLLEDGEVDPYMSTVRRWAMSVGVLIDYRLTTLDGKPLLETTLAEQRERERQENPPVAVEVPPEDEPIVPAGLEFDPGRCYHMQQEAPDGPVWQCRKFVGHEGAHVFAETPQEVTLRTDGVLDSVEELDAYAIAFRDSEFLTQNGKPVLLVAGKWMVEVPSGKDGKRVGVIDLHRVHFPLTVVKEGVV